MRITDEIQLIKDILQILRKKEDPNVAEKYFIYDMDEYRKIADSNVWNIMMTNNLVALKTRLTDENDIAIAITMMIEVLKFNTSGCDIEFMLNELMKEEVPVEDENLSDIDLFFKYHREKYLQNWIEGNVVEFVRDEFEQIHKGLHTRRC